MYILRSRGDQYIFGGKNYSFPFNMQHEPGSPHSFTLAWCLKPVRQHNSSLIHIYLYLNVFIWINTWQLFPEKNFPQGLSSCSEHWSVGSFPCVLWRGKEAKILVCCLLTLWWPPGPWLSLLSGVSPVLANIFFLEKKKFFFFKFLKVLFFFCSQDSLGLFFLYQLELVHML